MTERVVGVGLTVTWDPNAPEAVLVSNDLGRTVLAARAHPNDDDRRNVVLVWNSVKSASLGALNDEAISGHRLWQHGLSDLMWLGIVEGSALRANLEEQNSVQPDHNPAQFKFLEHYIVLLKECVVEVVASSVELHRLGGATVESAAVAVQQG